MQPKSLVIVRRGIVRGMTTLFRERQWATALGALLGVFILVQLLLLVFTGLQGVRAVLHSRTDLRLEIRAEASEADTQEFISALAALPSVRETVFITKEKAYETLRTSDPELIAFLEEFRMQNPFADTIGVTLSSLDSYEQFSAFVEQARWQTIVDPTFLSKVTDQEKQVYALLDITDAAESFTLLVLLVAGAALVCITTELVRRRALYRSDEVLIERLVGASPFSIAVPFLIEAVVLVSVAIILSGLLLGLLVLLLPAIVPTLQSSALGPLLAAMKPLLSSLVPALLFLEIVCALVIAALGTWLGIRPHITSPRLALIP